MHGNKIVKTEANKSNLIYIFERNINAKIITDMDGTFVRSVFFRYHKFLKKTGTGKKDGHNELRAGDSTVYKEKEAKVALKTNKKASGKILQQISKRAS
ncbi:hypothetical protein [Listeria monocytogenes]|uniref:hypothetical protein n=1 Tax=Listeria monocytogenes TaxID=1639 RepID=UPI000873C126|nr:hypothetical protein [Listeria monocytogenes]EAD8369558.1 hypothetical protein [Listeria monocytogenes]EGB1115140.1 hypothetical protein [Listeria monocytogenes]EGI8088326.1 hypothetical protein [Listeria monocytogenes]EHS5045762.1 hypothetical protein [Listeria monocytogenes]EKZ0297080.1 hypothetical protein [Listeria monocytogenes]